MLLMGTDESLKRAIVVTDDGEMVRKEISSLLQKAGFEILSAPDGAATLRLCRDETKPVDLVVIDADVVKRDPSAIGECVRPISSRVLFLSDGETENLAELVRGHVFRILAKPFRRAQLLGQVLEIMDQPLVLSA